LGASNQFLVLSSFQESYQGNKHVRGLKVKIVFLNRYFFPDHSATSQLLSDLAFHLASQGCEVHVIASRQRYDEPGAQLPPQETIRRVTVHRVWTSAFGRGNLPGRALDYLTFYICTGFALLRLASPGDVVVAKTDPPLLSLVAGPIAWLKGARLINWLQDIFPEVAGAIGMGWAGGWLGRVLARLRDRTLRSAYLNVVLGSTMQRYLISRGVGESKLRVIHNWADGISIRPVLANANRLRREWGYSDRFVVMYSGNLGRVHEFQTIIEAAEQLRRDEKILFLFVGGGQQASFVRNQSVTRRLQNVEFQPYQSREVLGESLCVGDVHLISLRPEVDGLIVPSKFYGIAAAGRPTIFVGSLDGEIAQIIDREQCGIAVRSGDASGLVAAIGRLKSDPVLLQRYGDNARRVFDGRFDKRIALADWEEVLKVRP
jgi:glycosyltransferase involved in cell wall biosynthesis